MKILVPVEQVIIKIIIINKHQIIIDKIQEKTKNRHDPENTRNTGEGNLAGSGDGGIDIDEDDDDDDDDDDEDNDNINNNNKNDNENDDDDDIDNVDIDSDLEIVNPPTSTVGRNDFDDHSIIDSIPDKEDDEIYIDPDKSGESNKDSKSNSDLDHSKPTDQQTNGGGNDVLIMNAKNEDRTTSFFAQPGILAAVIGGAFVGLLCAILVVMFIVYRMRKKDEGSYALDEPKRSPAVNSYAKNGNNREFYAWT